MVMVSKFSNFPNELSENDELREYELGGSDSTGYIFTLRELLCIIFFDSRFSNVLGIES